MKMNEYQELASRTINKELLPYELEKHALHGMVGEIGEIHSIYQKQYQGHPTDVWEQIHQTGPMGFLQKLMKMFK